MSHRRVPGVDPATTDPTADASPHRPRARLLAGGVAAAAVLASTALYTFGPGAEVHPFGPDIFAYIWQTRLVGTGRIAQVGTRPGLPVLGSVLSGFHAVSAGGAALILGLVLAVALGLAIAVALRLAFRLPSWSLGVVAFTTAVWGGSVDLSKGYLANELSLLCIVVATLLVALPGGHTRARILGSFAAATAAGIAHAGFLPFYAAVDGVWLLLSLPRIVGARHTGHRWWEDASVRSLAILAGATAVTALVIFGLMGLHVSDITNLTAGIHEFSQKLSAVRSAIGLWITAFPILAVAGAVAAWRLRGPASRDLTRAGLAWALCSAAGGLATQVHPSVPGHRALLVILPLPAAAGLGIVWIAGALRNAGRGPAGTEAEPRPRAAVPRALAAVGIVAATCALVAAPGLSALRTYGAQPHVLEDPARLVASYVATVAPTTPVVVFARATPAWRIRQNQVRAYVPTSNIASTFVVGGILGGADGATPEQPPAVAVTGDEGLLSAESEQSWIEGGPALRSDGAVVVSLRGYNSRSGWKALSADHARVVAPGLVVIQGPETAPTVALAPPGIPSGEAMVRALACLLILAASGGGYAAAAARALNATMLDAAALAPAVGAVLVVLIGLAVALPGGDPRGPVGLAAVTGVAVAGYVLAGRARARATAAPA